MSKHRRLRPTSALITPAEGHPCSTVEIEHALPHTFVATECVG